MGLFQKTSLKTEILDNLTFHMVVLSVVDPNQDPVYSIEFYFISLLHLNLRINMVVTNL